MSDYGLSVRRVRAVDGHRRVEPHRRWSVLPTVVTNQRLAGTDNLQHQTERTIVDFLRPCSAQLLKVLRIMSCLPFLQHGATKYLNIPVGPMRNASPLTLFGAAGIIELVTGALLMLGLFTRPEAYIFSGMCAVAYFYAHAGRNFYPILNGGELPVLYTFVFLYLAAAGGGPLNLDCLIRKNTT